MKKPKHTGKLIKSIRLKKLKPMPLVQGAALKPMPLIIKIEFDEEGKKKLDDLQNLLKTIEAKLVEAMIGPASVQVTGAPESSGQPVGVFACIKEILHGEKVSIKAK